MQRQKLQRHKPSTCTKSDGTRVGNICIPLSKELRLHYGVTVMHGGQPVGVQVVRRPEKGTPGLQVDRMSVMAGDIVLWWNEELVVDPVRLTQLLDGQHPGTQRLTLLRQGQLLHVPLVSEGVSGSVGPVLAPELPATSPVSISVNTVNGIRTLVASFVVNGQSQSLVLTGTPASVSTQFEATRKHLPPDVMQAIQSKLQY